MTKVVVFTEEPRGDRDERAVGRKNTNEDWVREISGRRTAVDFVDVLVSSSSGATRRGRGRNKRRERKGGSGEQEVVAWDE
jgi:hypothetical protein